MVLSTCFDLLARRNKSNVPNKLLIAFSVYTNGELLFKVNRDPNPNSIACVEGIRALSAIFLVLGHRFIEQIGMPVTNLLEFLDQFKHYYILPFIWENQVVDTFLLLGGLFCASTTLQAFSKKRFNAFVVIISRYLRYTPLLGAILICYLAVFRHLSGLLFLINNREICSRYWWSVLLHIQNYVNPNEICGAPTWYLSVDFQLFLITPVLIYPSLKYGWKYLWVLPVLAISSCVYTLIISLEYKLKLFFPKSNKDWEKLVYMPAHTRMSPWLVGMLLGYIFFKTRNKAIKMSKTIVTLLWMVALGAISAIVIANYPLFQIDDTQPSLEFNAYFIAFHRLLWAIAVAWIIFSCHKLKSGGFVRWFLSLPEWQPISRLSLCMYLVHQFYQFLTFKNLNETPTIEITTTVSPS